MQAYQIGPAFATDLINQRPFGSWDDVAKLSGIGKVRLTSLQSLFLLSDLESFISASGLRCFLPLTLLPCSLGTYKSVESFRVGDVVLSAAGDLLEITSLKVHDEAPQNCVELCAGDVTNKFTESHRVSILRAARRQAVRAGTLRPGDDVFMSGGGTQKLSVVRLFRQVCPVYEFTFAPDLPVESYTMLPGAILTHGRGTHAQRSHNRVPLSIPDTDSEWGYA